MGVNSWEIARALGVDLSSGIGVTRPSMESRSAIVASATVNHQSTSQPLTRDRNPRAPLTKHQRYHDRLKANGRCTRCGGIPEAGYTSCIDCIDRAKAINTPAMRQAQRDRHRAAGRCSRCGRVKVYKFVTCLDCRRGIMRVAS